MLDEDPPDAAPLGRSSRAAALLVAWVVLGLWGAAWVFSVQQDKLAKAERTWLNALDFLGEDFMSPLPAERAGGRTSLPEARQRAPPGGRNLR